MADTTEPTAPGRVLCLDTSVLAKYFSLDEQEVAATSDGQLLRQLGAARPAYVHDLGELAAANPGMGPGQGEAGV